MRIAFPLIISLAVTVAPWFGVVSTAMAQVFIGEVTEVESLEPVRGAFVALLDPAGAEVAGALTDEAGRVRIRAPTAGHFMVRVDRIGYAVSPPLPVDLRPGVTSHRIELASDAVELVGLHVGEGRRQCTVEPQEGTHLQSLWDQIRLALRIAAWTEHSGYLRSEQVLLERLIDPVTGRIDDETVRGPAIFPATGFVAAPPEVLARDGFIRWDGENYVFHGLDASTIVSDVFLETHCLRLRGPGPERQGLIGLAFEPVPGGRLPDVHGVLWVDASTAELRSLEYGYTWLPWRLPVEIHDRFGGRTEFRRLPSGAWIVQGWTLRMPTVERVPPDLRRDRRPVRSLLAVLKQQAGLRIKEVGGEVSALYTLDGKSLPGPRPGLLPTPVVRLDSLVVTAVARPRLGVLGPMRDRAERLRLFGGGTIIGPDDLMRRRPVRISHLLASIPGVRIVSVRSGGRILPLVSSTRSMLMDGGVCPMAIYLDGVPFPLGDHRWGELQSIDDLLPAGRLEAVEVYSGPTQHIPPEFWAGDAGCGVVALWTRRDASAVGRPRSRLRDVAERAKIAAIPAYSTTGTYGAGQSSLARRRLTPCASYDSVARSKRDF